MCSGARLAVAMLKPAGTLRVIAGVIRLLSKRAPTVAGRQSRTTAPQYEHILAGPHSRLPNMSIFWQIRILSFCHWLRRRGANISVSAHVSHSFRILLLCTNGLTVRTTSHRHSRPPHSQSSRASGCATRPHSGRAPCTRCPTAAARRPLVACSSVVYSSCIGDHRQSSSRTFRPFVDCSVLRTLMVWTVPSCESLL